MMFEHAAKPLAGIRVLSLAQQYPGPYATLLLSDLGADVVCVERPGVGDPSRRYPEFFAALNRGKRSVALDLKEPADVSSVRALVAHSDVVIEGFRPSVASRLGLDAATLMADDPRLVYVSISGFGQDGPDRDRPAHDLSYLALAGLLPVPADGAAPAVPYLSLADLTAGLFGAIAVLTGLTGRAASGRGGYYDVAMFDTLLSLLTSRLVPHLNGADDEGLGEDPGYGVFRTADDRWLTISISFEDHFWQRLCTALDLPDLAPLLADERLERVDELRSAVAAVLARRPLAWATGALTASDVPHGEVRGLADLADAPQVQARRMLGAVGSRPGRTYLRQPLKVDGTHPGPLSGSPDLGEHTAEVLADVGWTGTEAKAGAA